RAWGRSTSRHCAFTASLGVFPRCSPLPCSRIDAPFAQCAPRLIGESKTGSCRVHTPFSVTASIAHPTEQCVHTVRCTSRFTLALSSAALALPIVPYGNWLAKPPPPPTGPARLGRLRRSTAG